MGDEENSTEYVQFGLSVVVVALVTRHCEGQIFMHDSNAFVAFWGSVAAISGFRFGICGCLYMGNMCRGRVGKEGCNGVHGCGIVVVEQ